MIDQIYERFNEVMDEKEIRQVDLAKMMGKSQQSVNITLKQPFSKVDYFLALVKLTGCNLLWLLLGTDGKYTNYPDLISVLKKSNEELQLKLDDVMEQLATQKEMVALLKKNN